MIGFIPAIFSILVLQGPGRTINLTKSISCVQVSRLKLIARSKAGNPVQEF